MNLRKLIFILLFLEAFISSFAAETYSRGIMYDPSTGGASPGALGYYDFRAVGHKRQFLTGTTPAISWKTNQHNISISADTTFTFSDTPSDTNTVRRMSVLLVGNGTAFFTNTATGIYWHTPVYIPKNGTNFYEFEWNLGTINGWLRNTTSFGVFVTDETTALTTGTGKLTFRMPFAMTVRLVRASLTTASSSGAVTIDINEGGTSIFSTTLTIDASEKTSTTAATAAVIGGAGPLVDDDDEITVDIDGAGTGATGLKLWFYGIK